MTPIITEPLKVERINIAISNLATNLIGTKIVQLSDLHYDGTHLSDEVFQEAIAKCNQEQAELIAITGDFVTDKPQPIPELAKRLQQLESKFGVYGCLGNHDSSTRCVPEQLMTALEKVEIKILFNEVAYPLGKEIALVGLADFWSRKFKPSKVLPQLEENLPRIVLSHNPDSAAILAKYRVDLQLSGHTHGGQVIIPGYGAAPELLQEIRKQTPKFISKHIPYLRNCVSVVKNWQWSEGWHQIGNNQLYVNRGLGTYFPGRFRCPPEITVITLERK
ncbi:Metallophosphoesterase [Hyella patelloides LEGE 07179]|uniref:Metallophosphoesterase n=1 Tax=Hyella patelloides LEGE 07179 TaxID=945734 RepID=A0A563W0D0_9CYAN|nr:metallophosphoesterase [Hyella patelloides]VEP17172.1 Metallophosphoesterase [Hyella patelloides LEGE 07179]